MLSRGDRSVRIDAGGIHVEPAKDGFWEDNLVAADPTDPARRIYYCVLEGPEVGVYARGTADLKGGLAEVTLPEHFAHVAGTDGLTVQLTPRSVASKGVAAVELSTRRLVLRELMDGRGTYGVDYLVQGVRAGREAYQVVRAAPGSSQGASRPR